MNFNWKTLPSLFVQAALVTAAAVLAVVLVTKYVSPIPLSISQTTTQKDSAFIATGESVVNTVPDKAEVTLGISKRENDIKVAQSSANQIMNNITAKLVELGIKKEDIQTQNYSIYPNYDYQKSPQELTGYSIDISLKVSLTDFTLLNQVVDTATGLGANQVGGIQFTISDELEKKVKQEARAKAIEDAKKNADELANLSGVKLGRVINVTEGTVNPPYPVMYARDSVATSAMGGAPTNVQPGSTSYNFSVTLSYETL